jgi:hypothetical protein
VGSQLEPISITWNGKTVSRATIFFSKLCAEAKQEEPPRLYKQIIFFYEGNKCLYIKPFN